MSDTYKAVEVSAPGVLRVVERPVSEPRAGQVRIRVEACGICHTDAATVMGAYPGLKLPRVPGHEVVGRIEALGSGVSKMENRSTCRCRLDRRRRRSVRTLQARGHRKLSEPRNKWSNRGRRICGSHDRRSARHRFHS
jgi:threonine dehydrogenase-like Zn-dependent dehydrogenase